MPIKKRNAIISDLITLTNSALTYFSIEGWGVLQLNQPIKVNKVTPNVYISFKLTPRRGWQFEKDIRNADNTMTHVEGYKQELHVQFSALRHRLITDIEDTINAPDILEFIKTYFLSNDGQAQIKSLNYEIYQPSEIQEPTFVNDSENFEYMPYFETVFILEQTYETSQPIVEEYNLKIGNI